MKRTIFVALALVVVIAVTLVLALRDNASFHSDPFDKNRETDAATDTALPKANYTVTFLNEDKSIFKQITVVSGEAPISPGTPTMMEGFVFNGWDADLRSVTKDMTVVPLKEEVASKNNAIAIFNGYGVTGDTVTLPLSLCGKVELCCFEARMTYDRSTLQFISFSDEDAGVTVNCDEENGVVYLNYISTNNTTGQVDLCDISFRLIGNSTKQISLNITVDLAVKVNEQNEYEKVNCDVRNGTIDLIGR